MVRHNFRNLGLAHSGRTDEEEGVGRPTPEAYHTLGEQRIRDGPNRVVLTVDTRSKSQLKAEEAGAKVPARQTGAAKSSAVECIAGDGEADHLDSEVVVLRYNHLIECLGNLPGFKGSVLANSLKDFLVLGDGSCRERLQINVSIERVGADRGSDDRLNLFGRCRYVNKGIEGSEIASDEFLSCHICAHSRTQQLADGARGAKLVAPVKIASGRKPPRARGRGDGGLEVLSRSTADCGGLVMNRACLTNGAIVL